MQACARVGKWSWTLRGVKVARVCKGCTSVQQCARVCKRILRWFGTVCQVCKSGLELRARVCKVFKSSLKQCATMCKGWKSGLEQCVRVVKGCKMVLEQCARLCMEWNVVRNNVQGCAKVCARDGKWFWTVNKVCNWCKSSLEQWARGLNIMEKGSKKVSKVVQWGVEVVWTSVQDVKAVWNSLPGWKKWFKTVCNGCECGLKECARVCEGC